MPGCLWQEVVRTRVGYVDGDVAGCWWLEGAGLRVEFAVDGVAAFVGVAGRRC